MTALNPEGEGAILATKRAMKQAGIEPKDVDYFCAHGTGTSINDKVESLTIHKVFGEYAKTVPVSSIKSMLGHTMGAASAIEAIVSTLAIQDNVVPPNINYETKDMECDLNIVANKALAKEVNIVISNSYAFGGNIASVVFKKYVK
ncbi:MAG: hypothetical protein KAX49_06290 [Halanaerobiales bacterium]|nr:hypothetical protein [Halanaerobiales bacterium]